MVVRLVHLKIRSEKLDELRTFYDDRVIPTLEGVKGCVYASLIQSVHHEDECVSLTLWENPEDAEQYSASPVFAGLRAQTESYLAESSEWKIKLTSDWQVDYAPEIEEPVVESHEGVEGPSAVDTPLRTSSLFYLRIFSMKVLPDKHEELKRVYHDEVMPVLLEIPGCRFAYLTESIKDKSEFYSITIWDSKQHADAYEASPAFQENKDKVKPTLLDLVQWKMGLSSKHRGSVITSEDIAVKGYAFVTGKSFR
jgi:quinol monooxygenase YgiN